MTSGSVEAFAAGTGLPLVQEAEAEADFGGLTTGSSLGVVRPTCHAEVERIVGYANETRTALTPRVGGRSQSGQSVAQESVSLDLSGLDAVSVDAAAKTVTCGPGASYRDVVGVAKQHGLLPRVAPLFPELSIGGVLSAGGFGSTSHRAGLAVANVDSFRGVLGSGESVAPLEASRGPAWDCMLGGIGHCGVITEATLRCERAAQHIRTFFLLYEELEPFLHDQQALAARASCNHLEGFCSSAIQGLKLGPGGRRVPLAKWMYGLHVGVAWDTEQPVEAEVTRGLAFKQLLHVEDTDPWEHAERYALRFEMMRATGHWSMVHPWVETFVTLEQARQLIPELLEQLPVFLGDGHRLSILNTDALPGLMAVPSPGPVFAFAVLPTGVPQVFREPALAALQAVQEKLLNAGAKRYLSGWLFEPDERAWKSHFGEKFHTWRTSKQKCDPNVILRSKLM